MGKAATEQEKLRQAKARLRRIQHYEQVTHNVSQTCRFFGVSRRQFYTWLKRYREHGLEGLKNLKSGSRKPHLATPPHIVALILRVRAERQYGPIRICLYLQRFHQVYVSVPTIYKILKRHGVPRVSMKRYRPGPRRRREFTVPGQSVQVDVKHLKLGGRRFYQFTAVDEATRYRVLRIYTHSSIPNAIAFLDEVRQRLPMAIQRVQTDHGNEFGTDWRCSSNHSFHGGRYRYGPGCRPAAGYVVYQGCAARNATGWDAGHYARPALVSQLTQLSQLPLFALLQSVANSLSDHS
jgi:transposase